MQLKSVRNILTLIMKVQTVCIGIASD